MKKQQQVACDHKNQRRLTYQSKFCPNCGAQLTYDVGERK